MKIEKISLILILLSILIIGCKNNESLPQNFNYEDLERINNISTATAKFGDSKDINLTPSEIEILKDLIANQISFDSLDIVKKCRFEPEVVIQLNPLNADTLTISFCSNCTTLKLASSEKEFPANYDNVEESVNSFLDTLHQKAIRIQSESPSSKRPVTQEKNSKALSTVDAISQQIEIIQDSIFSFTAYAFFNPESESMTSKEMDSDDTAKIISLLQNEIQKGVDTTFRMCGAPITEKITFTLGADNKLDVFVSSLCKQLTISSKNKVIIIENPSLIKKIHKILRK